MPLNFELSTLRPTTRPGVTAVLVKDLANPDLMMAILEVVVSLVLTMDTLEVVNPVLMTGLAKAVANLEATPKDTKVLALMMDQRAAAKDPVSLALMADTREEEEGNPDLMMATLEVVASPVLTMATLEVAMEEIVVPMTTTVVTEEEMEVEMVEIMTMTPPCNPQTIFSQIWTSRTK